MKYTLYEYLKHYDPTTIQLLYGTHIVNIDTNCGGSFTLIRVFRNEHYNFVSFKYKHLILEY